MARQLLVAQPRGRGARLSGGLRFRRIGRRRGRRARSLTWRGTWPPRAPAGSPPLSLSEAWPWHELCCLPSWASGLGPHLEVAGWLGELGCDRGRGEVGGGGRRPGG